MIKPFILFLLLFSPLFSSLLITDNDSSYDNFTLEYYYDQGSQKTIQDIQQHNFDKSSLNSFTFGYIEGTTWFKIEFKNLSNREEFVLSFNEAIWKKFNLYQEQDGVWTQELNGLDIPLAKRTVKDTNPAFNIHIDKNSTKVVYIQGQTIASQIGKFELFKASSYYNPSRITISDIYILFSFSLLLIVILNSYSFFLTKEKEYLYYIAYTIASIIFASMHSGSYLLLGLDGWSEGLHVTGTFVILFLLLFSDKFLNLKELLPTVHKFFMFSVFIFLLFATLIYNNVAYSSILFNIYSALFFVLLFFGVIKVFLQGFNGAKYYLIALLIYAPLMALMIATFNTFIDYNEYSRHLFLAGAFIEILFFTLILTSKYKELNLQKIKIQEELLLEKNRNEELLEIEIAKRTQEINEQKKKFETIYQVSKDGLAVLDTKTTQFIEMNDAYAEIVGYSVEELLNRTCISLIVKEDKERSVALLKDIVTLGYIRDAEKKCLKKDGTEISVSMSATLMNDAKHILISVKDITKSIKLIKELEKSQKEFKELASIDPLTKLYNRRHFNELAGSLFDLAHRNKTETYILILDIDNFKKINDTYGHKTGDDVLVLLSSTLGELSRKSDLICRWGGEEFVLLLPETDLEGALIMAEKIRLNVEKLITLTNTSQNISFTVSIGVSQVNENIDASIHRANSALYKAKNSGKNRVEFAQ